MTIEQKITWYMKYRTTIWSTIWFIAGIIGSNSDRLYNNLSIPYRQSMDIQRLDEKINSLERRILKLEIDRNMKMPLWSGAICENIG